MPINDAFLNEYLMSIKAMPWYCHNINYLVVKFLSTKKIYQQRKNLISNIKY